MSKTKSEPRPELDRKSPRPGFVWVSKNGRTEEWSQKQWDYLGNDKMGWELVPTLTESVADALAA